MASLSKTRPVANPYVLDAAQLAICAVIGVALWFGAALLIAALAPMGALRMPGIFVFYALLIPGTIPFVFLARRLARLRREQTMAGVTIVTAAASLCDGVALVALPKLYGGDTAGAGAVILWGVGVGLVLGVVMNRPA